MSAVWTVAALAGVLAAGCGSGEKPCLPNAGTGAVVQETSTGTAYLTGVSITPAGCSDRISFTFSGRIPGYRVEYRTAAQAQTEDASGRHVDIAGGSFLVVRLADAQTVRTHGDGSITPTYRGATRLPPNGAHHVREVVKTGDFEAVVTWVIGLDGKRPFAIETSGYKIVVDIG